MSKKFVIVMIYYSLFVHGTFNARSVKWRIKDRTTGFWVLVTSLEPISPRLNPEWDYSTHSLTSDG
jgi:hypothetical protein